jgi:hypothetical protein
MLIVRRAMQGHREILSTMPALQTEGQATGKKATGKKTFPQGCHGNVLYGDNV